MVAMSDEGFDIGGLLRQAQELQAQMAAAEQAAGATVVEGTAGGGVVKVTMTAAGEFQSVSIAPEVVDPDDVEMLQDLVLAAVRDAIARAAEVQARNAPQLGDLGLPDLGDLGRLLGGGGGGGATS
jgi:DNA-binding YbaB/EbfC family protein